MMALPTMTPRLSASKNIYEQVIVARRNKLDNYHQNWSNNSAYFKNSDVRTSKLSAWTSDKSYKHSMDAYQNLKEKENKSDSLLLRRRKLADMYEQDRATQQAELSGLSPENSSRLRDLRDRSEGLKSAREDRRKQDAAEKMYDHWRLDNPQLRQVQSEQHRQHVVDSWKEQVDDNQQRLATARREKEDFECRLERERLEAIRLETEEQEAKISAEKQLKVNLKRQMDELRSREEEGRRLKREEDDLIKHQWQVDELEAIQTQRQELHNKQQFGRLLLKQHVAQMKRKSHQIQQELEEDLELLRHLLSQDDEDSEIRLARKEQARADAVWMKEVLDDQMKLEKTREAEMEMIYQHEATRMWEKREAEWTRERAARQRLMKEVFESRQEQIHDRMREIQKEKQSSLDERERLIREMDIANQMTHREQEKSNEAKTARRDELKQQITTQREENDAQLLRLRLDDEEANREDMEEENLLREETERLAREGFTHRDVGRRKQAWQ